MKFVLRHTRTNLYLQGPEHWTSSPELALDFRFTDRAMEFAQTWELEHVELAFVYQEGTTFRSISMPGACGVLENQPSMEQNGCQHPLAA